VDATRRAHPFVRLFVKEHRPALFTEAPLVLTRTGVVVRQEEVEALRVVAPARAADALVGIVTGPEHGEALVAETPGRLTARWPGMVMRKVKHKSGSRVAAASRTLPFGGEPIKEHAATLYTKPPSVLTAIASLECQCIVAPISHEPQRTLR